MNFYTECLMLHLIGTTKILLTDLVRWTVNRALTNFFLLLFVLKFIQNSTAACNYKLLKPQILSMRSSFSVFDTSSQFNNVPIIHLRQIFSFRTLPVTIKNDDLSLPKKFMPYLVNEVLVYTVW